MGIIIMWSLAFLVVNVVGMWEVKTGATAAGLTAARCKEERRIGLNECKPVLYGKLPSPSFCERVRVSHIECVCPVITPKLAALLDVNRAIRLVERCGVGESLFTSSVGVSYSDIYKHTFFTHAVPPSSSFLMSKSGGSTEQSNDSSISWLKTPKYNLACLYNC